ILARAPSATTTQSLPMSCPPQTDHLKQDQRLPWSLLLEALDAQPDGAKVPSCDPSALDIEEMAHDRFAFHLAIESVREGSKQVGRGHHVDGVEARANLRDHVRAGVERRIFLVIGAPSFGGLVAR